MTPSNNKILGYDEAKLKVLTSISNFISSNIDLNKIEIDDNGEFILRLGVFKTIEGAQDTFHTEHVKKFDEPFWDSIPF